MSSLYLLSVPKVWVWQTHTFLLNAWPTSFISMYNLVKDCWPMHQWSIPQVIHINFHLISWYQFLKFLRRKTLKQGGADDWVKPPHKSRSLFFNLRTHSKQSHPMNIVDSIYQNKNNAVHTGYIQPLMHRIGWAVYYIVSHCRTERIIPCILAGFLCIWVYVVLSTWLGGKQYIAVTQGWFTVGNWDTGFTSIFKKGSVENGFFKA